MPNHIVKHLYTLVSYRQDPTNPDLKRRFQESIVAETWSQALVFWHTEFIDEGVDVEQIIRQDPVIRILSSESTPS